MQATVFRTAKNRAGSIGQGLRCREMQAAMGASHYRLGLRRIAGGGSRGATVEGRLAWCGTMLGEVLFQALQPDDDGQDDDN